MPLGTDKQYDLPWDEQDKIRRRLEIKDRLKQEGVRRRYDPFLQMKEKIYSDPAIDRYADLRKKGRVPGAPFKPQIFFGLIGVTVLPIIVFAKIITWERKEWLEKCAVGDIPLSERIGKALN